MVVKVAVIVEVVSMRVVDESMFTVPILVVASVVSCSGSTL